MPRAEEVGVAPRTSTTIDVAEDCDDAADDTKRVGKGRDK